MSQVQIASTAYDAAGGNWSVFATITLADGTRSGSHSVDLPKGATEEELAAAVLALYEPPADPAPATKKAGKK